MAVSQWYTVLKYGIPEKRDPGSWEEAGPRTLWRRRTLGGSRTLWGFRILWWPRKDPGTYYLAKVSWFPHHVFNLVENTIKGRFIYHCWMQINLAYTLFWKRSDIFHRNYSIVIQEILIYMLTACNNYSTCFYMN